MGFGPHTTARYMTFQDESISRHFTLHRRHRTFHGLRIILKSFVRDLSEDFVCPMTSATNILFAASKHSFLMKFPTLDIKKENL